MNTESNIINAASLLDLEIDNLPYIVKNLVVPGLTLLAAAPKEGKSFLILYLAYCIGVGQMPFGKLKVKKSQVLYLALEDNPRRLKARLQRIVSSSLTGGISPPDSLDLMTSIAETNGDKLETLKNIILEKGYKVVFVDILQRLAKDGETGSYKKDYTLVRRIKQLADATNCSIVVVHHTNKKSSKRSIDAVSGTRGIVGACDNVMVLSRTSDESSMSHKGVLKLAVQGRDLDSNKFYLEYGSGDGFYIMNESEPVESPKTEKMEKAWELKQQKYTQDQIAELMGVTQGYVCKLLKSKRENLLSQGNLDDADDIDPEELE